MSSPVRAAMRRSRHKPVTSGRARACSEPRSRTREAQQDSEAARAPGGEGSGEAARAEVRTSPARLRSAPGQGFVTQGIALDIGTCLRLTDPLAVTIHAR